MRRPLRRIILMRSRRIIRRIIRIRIRRLVMARNIIIRRIIILIIRRTNVFCDIFAPSGSTV